MPDADNELDGVLDAAASCYLRLGVAGTTAADIAKAAGISRATLYRRYGTHEAIFLAVLARESRAMAADAAAVLAALDDPADRIVEGMMYAIDQIQRRPVHAAVFGGDSAAWAATRAIRLSALRRVGEDGVWPLLQPALERGALSELDVADLVDWILRVLISFAAVPGPADRDTPAIRRQIQTWFLPAVVTRLTGPAGP